MKRIRMPTLQIAVMGRRLVSCGGVGGVGGVGGKAMIPGRPRDSFGVCYFYNGVQTTRLTSALGLEDHAQGLECFCNIAVTPAALLTLDAQFIDSAQSNLDTGVVLGVRLKLEL